MSDSDAREVQVQFETFDNRLKVSQNVFSLPINTTVPQMSSMIFSMLKSENTVSDSLLSSVLVFEIDGTFVMDTLEQTVGKLNLEEERLITIKYSIQLADPELSNSIEVGDWVACIDVRDEWLVASCFDGYCYIYKDSNLVQSIKNVDVNMNFDARFVQNSTDEPFLLCCMKNCNIGMFKNTDKEYIQTHTFVGHNDPVTSVSVSPQQTDFFASGSVDRLIKLWSLSDLPENKVKNKKKSEKAATAPIVSFSGHTDVITKVRWGKDYELLSSSWDMSIRIWDIQENKLSRHISTKFAINDIDFDGESLVLSASGKIVQLWDYRTRELVSTINSKYSSMTSIVKFSPVNRNEFLVASHHGATHMWDRRNLKNPLYKIHETKQKMFTAFIDEKRIILGGQDGNISFYPLVETTVNAK